MKNKFLTVLAAAGVTGLMMASAAMRQSQADDTGERNVTRVTAQLLEHSQFAHHPLDRDFAGKFLEFYLDALDGQHSIFLQSDVAEFQADLPRLAARTSLEGDTTPARSIFNRFLQRISQRADYSTHLLETEKFDFTGNDALSTDREKAQRPADIEAAQALWREQLRAEYLQEELTGKKPEDIVQNLTKRYARGAQTMKNFSEDEILDVYLNSLAHVYDPHSDYFGKAERDEFSIAMNLSFVGIGATLRLEDGLCKVTELVPGGPAARSGLLHPGDKIVAVGQPGKDPVDITYMPLGDAVQLIRGPKDTKVVLTLVPSGASDSTRKNITLTRDKVKLDEQRAKALIVDVPDGKGGSDRVGVLHLPAFYSTMGGHDGPSVSVTEDATRLLNKLKQEKIHGLVLDLRSNGGGSLEEAINFTGLFIQPGPVVQTKDPKGGISVSEAHDSAPLYDGPMVVLINRLSASASEIVAGALQDYGRAVVIGDSSTFGKGTVQSIVPLAPILKAEGLKSSDDPGSLKLTISKFYRPSGASTQLKGVASDLVLPSITDISEIGEAKLKDPLPWDTIRPADFEKDDRVSAYVHELRARSLRRQGNDPEFGYLREDIARNKKTEAEKSVSLNEETRKQEMDADKKRDAERAKARKERHDTPATAYEITLENVDHPGLPPAKNAAKVSTPDAPLQEQNPAQTENSQNPPPEDAALLETERIVVDYENLLKGPPESVTADR